MEKMVVKIFADMQNKHVQASKCIQHSFTKEHFKCKWYIVPVNEIRTLYIHFPIPDSDDHVRSDVSIFEASAQIALDEDIHVPK